MEEFFSIRCAAGHPMVLESTYYGCPECRPPADRTGIRRLLPSLGWVKGAIVTAALLVGVFLASVTAAGILDAIASVWVPGLM